MHALYLFHLLLVLEEKNDMITVYSYFLAIAISHAVMATKLILRKLTRALLSVWLANWTIGVQICIEYFCYVIHHSMHGSNCKMLVIQAMRHSM